MDWLEAVDRYLYAVARIGIEDTLAEGCISGAVPSAVASFVSIEPEPAYRCKEEDGGQCEIYRGALTVAGLRYLFEARLFIDGDGAHFIADVPKFEPVEWQAGRRALSG
jgi:hypothetical protein